MQNVNVLILEDDLAVQNSLAAYLEDYDFIIYKACDGESALEIIKNNKVDVAIVDVRLSKMSGIEFIKHSLKLNDYTNYIIHTGSPDFTIPVDIVKNKRVSGRIFEKPMNDLSHIIEHIIFLISNNS